MNSSLSRRLTFSAVVSAFLGVFVLTIGITISFEAYNEIHEVDYSPANHFISELGWEKRSPAANWFNGSLAVFCLSSLPLMIALGVQFRTGLGYFGMCFGVTMLLAGIGVAIFPLDRLRAHLLSALVLFWAFFLTMVTFSAASLVHRRTRWSWAMAMVGFLCVGVAVIFLVLPKDTVRSALQNINEFERPEVWWLTIFEWAILVCGIIWGATAAMMLLFKNPAK